MLVLNNRWDTKGFALYGALLGLVGGMMLNFFDAFWGQVPDDDQAMHATVRDGHLYIGWSITARRYLVYPQLAPAVRVIPIKPCMEPRTKASACR